MNWYFNTFKYNYANFEGRARREEFWMFTLFHFIALFVLAIASTVIAFALDFQWTFILLLIYVLATFIPSLAINVRRLHDIDKSGWYFLMSLIPYAGGIIMLVYNVKEGTKGRNQYGPDPKNPELDEIDAIGKPLIDA